MKYNLSKDRVDSLKEYMIKFMKRQLFYDEFVAIKDISLEISKGEIFGLVGLNGAGKSTLLKLVAGVIKPTIGTVYTQGTIAPLIELGAGFDAELTARENVYMNGAVMGYSVKYMKERFEQIIDFAELWEFVDVPIKNYSSGMQARLGFSVATIVKPEILIVDEILGVGDYKFQQKCKDRIKELMCDGTTVLMVSHTPDFIIEYCDRAAWLEKGELIDVGPAKDICNRYLSI
jgi:ABC-2 type transport system ATP-binding protein/lipopolysaccharide transport system ATP-binding protein